MNLGIIILAAGQGTRMRSSQPKVLHRLAGRPLLSHVLETARDLQAARIAVVYGHGGEQVRSAIGEDDVDWIEQAQQLGTGHAVEQALPAMAAMDRVLVLYGDVPLISADTLQQLLQQPADLALLSVELADPTGYGRILRDGQGAITGIVEQKDASADQLAIREGNSGVLVADREILQGWINRLESNNAQGEFYLTDVVAMAVADGCRVASVLAESEQEVLGVNDRLQLARLERCYQQRQAERLMRQGVTLRDPQRFDLRGELVCGRDVEIDVNVIIEGRVELGDGVRVGANTLLRDLVVAEGTEIRENCVLESSRIGPGCMIGPFARLRPDSELGPQVHLGNFVEVKKSTIADGSKVNHLSYIGDSSIGRRVNMGAGTITCNYDGANKFRTVIEDDAFIGSDTQLVAPVTVGRGATIGAGSTITKDTPPETLTLSRSKQLSLKGWQRPVKQPKD